jgi:protein-S-isoprenylcysteine O-methyltransferase Ste14
MAAENGASTAVTALRVLGLAAFSVSLAFMGWWWAVPAGRGGTGGGAAAALADVLLFSVFALHHSVMARSTPKRLLNRFVPPVVARSVYVWVASALLVSVCAWWQPIGGVLYDVRGPLAALLPVIQLAGAVLVVLAARCIRLAQLAGLADPDPDETLQHHGPYAIVRHPIYLGGLLLLFASPRMTADRLAFAAASGFYLVLAVPFEEAALSRQFGARYDAYRDRVRSRIVPLIY